MVEDKRRFIRRLPAGEDAPSVGEIEQALQLRQLAFLPQLLHTAEHRAEIRLAQALDLHGVQILLKFLRPCDPGILPNPVVALENVNVHLCEQIFLPTQNSIQTENHLMQSVL